MAGVRPGLRPSPRLSLGGLALASGLALLVVPGCKSSKTEPRVEPQAKTQAPVPSTAEAFLAELVPLPGGAEAIEVRYTVTGPAVRGELSTLIAPGGKRRDKWELQATTEGTELRTAGLTVVTAEHIYVSNEGAPGELEQNSLAGLAEAYLELEPQAQAQVMESIHEWHELLAEQREQAGGDHVEVLGVSCLRTRVAAQNVCMWEQTGLLLRYEGSAFTLEATEIDRDPKLPTKGFALPAAAEALQAKPAADQDYAKILDQIAAGSYGQVSLLVLGSRGAPTLQLPEPEPAG